MRRRSPASVAAPHATAIGARRIGHHAALTATRRSPNSKVSPARTFVRTPGISGIRAPSRTSVVPLVEWRSTIHAPVESPPISKCVFESDSVSSRTGMETAPCSFAGLRP